MDIGSLLTLGNITLAIALWGAILSTYKAFSDYTKKSRKVRVYLAYGFSTGLEAVPTLSISAQNTGFRDVTLNSAGFVLPDKKYLLLYHPRGTVNLPHTLSEGTECTVFITQRELAEDLLRNGFSGNIKLGGYYRSAVGKTYKSKSIDFDIQKALSRT